MSTYSEGCIHRNGMKMFREGKCKTGVTIVDFNGGEKKGLLGKLPCSGKECVAKCDKFLKPSAEQIKEHEGWFEEAVARITKLNPLIKKLKEENPNGGVGNVECHACGKNLHWSVSAYNGHIHLKCETDDCVSMME